MNAENFASDDSGNRKTIECVNKGFPDLDIAPALALIVKTVYPRYVGTFMVASEQEKVLWEFQFIAEEKENRL